MLHKDIEVLGILGKWNNASPATTSQLPVATHLFTTRYCANANVINISQNTLYVNEIK